MTKNEEKDINILKLLKVFVENKEDFVNNKEKVFRKVLDEGLKLKYFDPLKHDWKKVRDEFWRHQCKKYRNSMETLNGNVQKLTDRQRLVHEVLSAEKNIDIIEIQHEEAGNSTQEVSQSIQTLTPLSSKDSQPHNAKKGRKSFAEMIEEKQIKKIDLEIENLELKNHIQRLEITKLERSLKLPPSTYAVTDDSNKFNSSFTDSDSDDSKSEKLETSLTDEIPTMIQRAERNLKITPSSNRPLKIHRMLSETDSEQMENKKIKP